MTARKVPAKQTSTKKTLKSRNSVDSDIIKPRSESSHVERFDWYSLYVYAICLVTILICIFSLVSFVRGIVDSLWPDSGYFDPYSVPKSGELTAQEIKQNLQEQNQRLAVKGIVNSFTTLIIAGPIYLYHWKLARKNRA